VLTTRKYILARWVVILSLAVSLLASDESVVIKDYRERIAKYVELHKKVKNSLDRVEESANAAILAKQKQQFATALRESRQGVMQGNIFTPGVQPIFGRIITQHLSHPNGKTARSMILGEGNPGNQPAAAPVLNVNAPYPTTAPSSTVPPSLLIVLPQLPEELEYRFIGRHLILRDREADLIVDFIRNAVP
jgi:hypothetical protein